MKKPNADSVSPGIRYPNRQLQYKIARTDAAYAYCPQTMAVVAISNLLPGEVFKFSGASVTVGSINETALTVVLANGRKRRIMPDSSVWDQLVRDVSGDILLHAHSRGWSPEPDIIKALKRDPAFGYDEKGLMRLMDPPEKPHPSSETAIVT